MMGFRKKWLGWMKWSIFTARFSVLVNGTSSCFFQRSKGLRQGDPLTLFICDCYGSTRLPPKGSCGWGFFSAYQVRGRGGEEVQISHLLFIDDTLLFCQASQDQMTYLCWILMWFEAISGLRINIDKIELIQMGCVEHVEDLAT